TAIGPIAALAAAAVDTALLYTRTQRQIEVLRSVSTIGDALASPAATQRSLRRLGEAARLLFEGSVAVLYTPAGTDWRLRASLTRSPNPPSDVLDHQLLAPIAAAKEVLDLRPAEHGQLFGALAPGDESLTDGVAAALLAGEEVVGVLVCLGSRPPASTTERELFRVITSVAGTVVQGSRLVERLAEQEPAHALLVGLRDETEPHGVLAARAAQLGVDLEEPHAAACFGIAGAGESGDEPERSLELLGSELGERV